MHMTQLLHRMKCFPDVVDAIFQGLSDDDARWRPERGGWSMLEVLVHLCDEEKEDFATRVRMTLDDPSNAWPGIDPERAARDRNYNDADVAESLLRFRTARAESIDWLRNWTQNNDDDAWEKTYEHPVIGPLRAGDVLVSWAAHDQLHLRQMARRCYDLVQRDAGLFRTQYAGPWPDAR